MSLSPGRKVLRANGNGPDRGSCQIAAVHYVCSGLPQIALPEITPMHCVINLYELIASKSSLIWGAMNLIYRSH